MDDPTDAQDVRRARVWLWAARPKTLGAAVAPVLVGTGMAVEAGAGHLPSAVLALAGAILIQVGVNYHNDYADYVQGADTQDRVGPLRVTQAGLVSPETMRRATILVFGLAVMAGLYLIVRGGWPILAVGGASIGAAVWYTAGRYSLAALGLADGFVFAFFGPVAVGGTYYVQALSLPLEVLVAGTGPGLLSIGILLVNNVRDVAEDRRAGKRTLIVRFGRRFGVAAYGGCMAAALLLSAVLATGVLGTTPHPWAALPLGLFPLAIESVRRLSNTTDPQKLNPLLGATGRLLVLWALLFAVGWNL
ncbi:1,4-dihydroxy-2-naphthoate polyprenyltransferase [Salinibacter altiplanensis]|uniref:1,4-dihydroxy-2-naphthoate polyprenyltransferase n=1 Tax=Salinibacter altiplanensis TaxID=1803181 RepID=UPI000C9F7181|nr:1,4-dihydroxy-2-naphthoate polyprenyltransferase [Salinibacter altiplanensis]